MVVALPPKAERVISLLKELDRSGRWLAQRVGVSPQVLNNWLNDVNQPRNPEVWQKMINELEKFRSQMGIKDAKSNYDQILGSPKIPVGFPTVRMRYAGEVPTGDWGDPLESEEFMEMDAQYEHPKRFCARVVGDSCYPALQPGDITIWHYDLSPPFQVIVLAQRRGDHGCTVKQLVYDPKEGRPRLKPVNPDHVEPGDGDGWGAIARLIAVLRSDDAPKRTWFWEAGLRPEHLK